MTQQESFKRRIRARMAKTGEKYNAARRALIDQSPSPWHSEPEVSDQSVREATGRSWTEWCGLIERPGASTDHAEIARWLEDSHGVDAWWAQTITVGYERIRGLRLPYQRPDGTFTAGKTRTVGVDASMLRAILLDDDDRMDLFPGLPIQLRSKPESKGIRISVGPGVALISIEAKADSKAKVTVAHEGLPTPEAVEDWKAYWAEWLAALDDQ